MNIFGKATINPVLFMTGKISGYIVYIIFILELSGIITFSVHHLFMLQCIAFVIGAFSLGIMIISFLNLGSAIRFGIPADSTELKTHGLYRFSRNPMYLSFNLLILCAMLFTAHPVIICLGVYSIVIYHFIILGEEKFLEQRFGETFLQYKQKVRRYL
ncbi:MAG: isoprenylcysteine carboxylmethyltransferase family protein [Spirochaetales bacterium]|nr:isoprenylcysteine carboxylmethyltransferase family protein [Spirochaetales bacterium]